MTEFDVENLKRRGAADLGRCALLVSKILLGVAALGAVVAWTHDHWAAVLKLASLGGSFWGGVLSTWLVMAAVMTLSCNYWKQELPERSASRRGMLAIAGLPPAYVCAIAMDAAGPATAPWATYGSVAYGFTMTLLILGSIIVLFPYLDEDAKSSEGASR